MGKCRMVFAVPKRFFYIYLVSKQRGKITSEHTIIELTQTNGDLDDERKDAVGAQAWQI